MEFAKKENVFALQVLLDNHVNLNYVQTNVTIQMENVLKTENADVKLVL